MWNVKIQSEIFLLWRASDICLVHLVNISNIQHLCSVSSRKMHVILTVYFTVNSRFSVFLSCRCVSVNSGFVFWNLCVTEKQHGNFEMSEFCSSMIGLFCELFCFRRKFELNFSCGVAVCQWWCDIERAGVVTFSTGSHRQTLNDCYVGHFVSALYSMWWVGQTDLWTPQLINEHSVSVCAL